MSSVSPFLAAPLLCALVACTPIGTAIGLGAAGSTVVLQERGFQGAANDSRVALDVRDRLFRADLDLFGAVNVTVNEGRVLLTGKVAEPDARVEAVRLAWQASGVREVINGIEVTDRSGLVDVARDTWITTRLRTRLLVDREIHSINYSIETVNRVVYILGIGQHPAEIARVVDHARDIPYVRRVVSHAVGKDDPRRRA